MKKQNFSIRLLILAGVFLVFASSCGEDVDNNRKKNIPVISITEVTEITTTTAASASNITNDGEANVNARGVCWSTNENPTIDDNKTEDGTGVGNFTSSITNLESNTTYYIKAYATNSVGIGYSDVMSFTTKESARGSFTDPRDGKVYQTVTIGTQVWMAENLAYLPKVISPSNGSLSTPFYYVYGYDGTSVADAKATTNYSTYGVIYNWEAAMVSSPAGWHMPSDAEWTQLTTYLGGESVGGGKLKEMGNNHWNSPNTGASNESGFTALPGGWRYFTLQHSFQFMGTQGYWWSATENSNNSVWIRVINYDGINLVRETGNEEFGFSVRCVKD